VSANNLHRDEAQERASLLQVDTVDVSLDVTSGAETFRSTTAIRFTCRQPGAASYVDLTASVVHEVTLNGERLDPAAVFDGNRIRLPGLAADNELVLVADCAYMRTGEGMHRFVDPVDNEVYLYTQFETFDAHRVYACFDQPDLKAVFRLSVTAPEHWTVVSNMAGTKNGGRWTFAATPRLSSYITALVAGPYHCVRDRHGDIDLGLYCRASLAEHLDADELFAISKQGFDFFQRMFDYPYPFGKYDQLFVPEFNAGAMENAGCVTFLEDYVFRGRETQALYERRAETILHEMAHMWFGDLVTMRWWDDLWLNESFASYMAVLAQAEATKYRHAWTTFCNVEKTWAYRQDQLPSTHPIAADIEDIEAVKVNFDGITYAKGASVLKQLAAWVGRDAFFAGLRRYFRRHEYANTTLQDFLTALEDSSGRDLSAWSKEWLEAAGVNTLRARFQVDAEDTFTSFTVLQEAPAEHPTLRSHRLAIGLWDRGDGGLLRRDRVELDVTGAETEVDALLGVRRPDLVLVNDDDLTYAKIRLDDRSLATLRESIGQLDEPLARALSWGAAWDMTRDAEMRARDYVELVLAGVARETEVGLVQTLVRQAKLALDSFVDPSWRSEGLARLAATARERMLAAEPGSDVQLVWTRAFALAATTAQHVAVLRSLLDGSESVPGLTIDVELRWGLLLRLAALGAAAEDDIAAELEWDNTATGQRYAAAARAARPTREAKDAAWRAAVESDTLPNALLGATIGGFQQADQRDLLASYVEPYFASISRVWEERTLDMAERVVVGLYPSYVISPDTISRTDAWLEREQPPAALRRLVLEGRAGVVRALRAQERDRTA
jgi:aminopeptidase N